MLTNSRRRATSLSGNDNFAIACQSSLPFRTQRGMNVVAKGVAIQHAGRNEVPSPSHSGNAGLPVRGLAGVLVGWLVQTSAVRTSFRTRVPPNLIAATLSIGQPSEMDDAEKVVASAKKTAAVRERTVEAAYRLSREWGFQNVNDGIARISSILLFEVE